MYRYPSSRLRRRVAIAGLLVGAMLPVGPTALAQTANLVVGSGRQVSESRQVAAFEAVAVHGSMTLIVRQAAHEAVEVRADDNLLPLIETRVVPQGGLATLSIGTSPGAAYATGNEVIVRVDLVSLTALSISGSGDAIVEPVRTAFLKVAVSGSGNLRVRRLATDMLSLHLTGSGDVEAAGRAGRLDISIAGSGNVDSLQLDSDDATVSIAGSGNASVQARRTLLVSIGGSGDVSYAGDAKVQTTVTGSGRVKRR
jgi:hypothetical protein